MSKYLPPKNKTINWQTYNQSLKTQEQQPTLSDAAIQFCLTIKCLFGLVLRQPTGMVESILRLTGFDRPVPDFSTPSPRQKDLQMRIPVQKKQGRLHQQVDSTGIKIMGEGK